MGILTTGRVLTTGKEDFSVDYETIFKALGEGTRIKIVKLLSIKPMYVCELESVLEMSQPRISQHLRILKQAGLLNMKKEGQRAVYSLNEDVFEAWITGFTSFLRQPLETLPEYQPEVNRIAAIANDPTIAICKNA
ncbi:metalloregulator ArsR/SmtB family transcription factor [Anoxynatronum sibiricum]|uniref:Metalloregulator ArsR/SmtB family transcription factor n=2 Tax=Anoxynatronum sibiricum TaxID=210623 RepID=A0ABU9VTU3_9CLOT